MLNKLIEYIKNFKFSDSIIVKQNEEGRFMLPTSLARIFTQEEGDKMFDDEEFQDDFDEYDPSDEFDDDDDDDDEEEEEEEELEDFSPILDDPEEEEDILLLEEGFLDG